MNVPVWIAVALAVAVLAVLALGGLFSAVAERAPSGTGVLRGFAALFLSAAFVAFAVPFSQTVHLA